MDPRPLPVIQLFPFFFEQRIVKLDVLQLNEHSLACKVLTRGSQTSNKMFCKSVLFIERNFFKNQLIIISKYYEHLIVSQNTPISQNLMLLLVRSQDRFAPSLQVWERRRVPEARSATPGYSDQHRVVLKQHMRCRLQIILEYNKMLSKSALGGK